MTRTLRAILLLFLTAGFTLTGRPAFAVPSLQLDIGGGTYDTVTESIVASSNSFTLYALLVPDTRALLTNTYFISASLIPQVAPPGATLGSISIDGTPYTVTDDMLYGNPPVDTVLAGQDHEPGDLPPHDIFPTYFLEYAFQFSPNDKATEYNTAENPGGPTANANGTMYYHAFSIDRSLLDPAYTAHFDLYDTMPIDVTETQTQNNQVCETNKKGKLVCRNVVNHVDVVIGTDIEISSFAPFSHDASGAFFECVDCALAPEPNSLIFLGIGLIGMGAARFLRKR